MNAPPKTCAPRTVAAGHGASTEVEATDRPAAHPHKITAPRRPGKLFYLRIVRRGGRS
jgi:hypothetical protein